MDVMEQKLVSCFSAVLPELSVDDITHARAASVAGWDSVATVSLLAIVEDEFGIAIEVDDLSQFDSFQGILGYLQRSHSQTESVTETTEAEPSVTRL